MKIGRGTEGAGARAERLRVRAWTDPRLLLGVLLVLGAAVAGARLVALSDDTVPYWSVAADARAGDDLTADQLTPVRVRLGDATRGSYLRVDDELPAPVADLTWGRDVTAGSLVDPESLVPRSRAAARQLPLTVANGSLPPDLRRGDRVEVWVGPNDEQQSSGRRAAAAVRLLSDVRVVRTGAEGGAVDGTLARTVLVEVPADGVSGSVISALSTGRVTLLRMS